MVDEHKRERFQTVGAPTQAYKRKQKTKKNMCQISTLESEESSIYAKKMFTLDLFFLQEAAHHLEPEPSITPFPWNTAPWSLEN